jgi:DNA-binding LytR/AlgR family response regulator
MKTAERPYACPGGGRGGPLHPPTQAGLGLTLFKRPRDIEKLAVTLDGRTILIPYTQIIFVEAYEDYSFVHTATQKFLTSYRLKLLEDRLKPHRFFRVHRKYLVNLDLVTEIASLPGGNFMLRTAGKTRIELPIGRRRIGELKTGARVVGALPGPTETTWTRPAPSTP